MAKLPTNRFYKISIAIFGAFILSINVIAQISNQPLKCLNFNGSNQSVTFQEHAALDFTTGTVEAWIKPTWTSNAPAGTPCVLAINQTSLRWSIHIAKNYSDMRIWNGTSNFLFTYSFAQNQLYHIAFVFTGTQILGYVNGYLVNTLNGTMNTAAVLQHITAGSANGTTDMFTGAIDEIRIWNVQRTSQQLRENMHLTLTGNETGLAAYYQFNEGSGNSTTDQKSSYSGQLNNSPSWINSTFPFGGGAVNTQLETNGAVNFAATNVSANYTSQNGASVTTSLITSAQPVTVPSGNSISSLFTSQYYIVNRYGSGSYSTALTFKTTEDLTGNDANNPSIILLYRRDITSDGAWTYVAGSNSIDAVNDKATFNSITSGLGEYMLARGNTLSTSPISGSPFCVPANLSVSYNGNGLTFNQGNIFTAQLSDASGSFASPQIIGSLTGTNTTGTIPVQLHEFIPSGTHYRIRITSSNPVTSIIFDNGTDLIINNPINISSWTGLYSSLVARYKFNGDANDNGPNLLNGTASNLTAANDRLGNNNSALHFNGTSGKINMGNPAQLRMYQPFSISVWVKRANTSASGYSCLVSKFDNGSWDGYQLMINNIDNTARFTIYNTTTFGGNIPFNRWTSIIAVYNGSTMRIYQDGVQVAQSNYGGNVTDNFNSFEVGSVNNGSWFGGDMDEMKIYKRALTAIEITELANDGIASSDSPICTTENLTIFSQTVSGASYSWNGPTGFLSSIQNPPTITNATMSDSGIYSLTVTANGCASLPQNTLVEIYPILNAPIAADSARCSNGSLTLSASGGTNGKYRWYTVASGGSPIASQFNSTYVTPPLSATTSYWVSALNYLGCESPRKLVKAIINSPTNTALTISGFYNICANENGLVDVVNSEIGVDYQAYIGANPISIAYSGTGSNLQISCPYTNFSFGMNAVRVKANKAGCGSVWMHDTLFVERYIPNSITSQPHSLNVCRGNSASFSVHALGHGLTYQWKKNGVYLNNGGVISGAEDSMLNINSADTSYNGNYICEITGDCSPDMFTTAVTLNVHIPAPLTVTSNTNICDGDTIFLSCSSVNGAAYQWQGPNQFTSVTQNSFRINSTTADSGIYYVSANDGICISNESVHVDINPVPAIPVITAVDTICSGSTLQLNAASNNATSYLWNGPNNFTSSNQQDSVMNLSTINSGVYYVNAFLGFCHSGNSKTIFVNEIPNQPSVILGRDSLCPNTNELYSVLNDPITTNYIWTSPANWLGASNTNQLNLANDSMSGSITVAAQNACGISQTQSVYVFVFPFTTKPIISDNGIYLSCQNVYSTYTWYDNWNLIAGAVNYIFTPSQNGSYSVYVVDSNGCIGISDTYVTTTVGLQNVFTDNDFHIFPNPFTENLFVSSNSSVLIIELLNTSSQVIRKYELTNKGISKINSSDLSPGIYYLRLIEVNQITTIKVLKE